jgi:hypothetical protein
LQQQQRPQSRQSLPSPPTFAPSPAPSIDSDQMTATASNRAGGKGSFYSTYYESRNRPPDPVALTLEAAQLRNGTPSPQVVNEKRGSVDQASGQSATDTPSASSNTSNAATSMTGTPKRKAMAGDDVESPNKKMVLPSGSTP